MKNIPLKESLICPSCSFPIELCNCNNVLSEKRIIISNDETKWDKIISVIHFEGKFDLNFEELLTIMKKKLGTGGTIKNKNLNLQGIHNERIKNILIKYGISNEIISIK